MESIQITYNIPHMGTTHKTAEVFGLSSYQMRKPAQSRIGEAFTVKKGGDRT